VPLWEWTYSTHDTLLDIVVTIVLENGAHVQKEVSHLFPHHIQQQVDILITRYGFWTLMDVIIVDPTCINMVQWTLTMITHATLMDAEEKTWSYVKRTLSKDFIPLAIETYGCFHFHFNSFLITCAQNTIVRHQWSYLNPSMFISHYQQHLSIALQQAQTITIFQWAVALVGVLHLFHTS